MNTIYGMLNVDLMRVFFHNPHSIGIIDAVILNIPRSERYKEEDRMILRVIPGPSEAKLCHKTYLKPIAFLCICILV